MPRNTKTVGNLALAGYEDIFSASTINADGERITRIPLVELHAPEFHPFSVNDDQSMYRLSDSIKKEGVRVPGIARPRADGGYELLCGNRRKRASEIAGIPDMPAIIRSLDDDSAVLVMVDDNLEQRETILPSEKAQAYRMMMEALNHSGVKGECHTYEIMEERTGMKKSQLFRLIRLCDLIVDLIDKVDAKQLSFNPAVELSYLSAIEQTAVANAMALHEVKPSLSQAIRLKKMKQSSGLTIEMIGEILAETKKPQKDEPKGPGRYRRFFPPEYSAKAIDKVITTLLECWQAEQNLNTAH
jgi:ParB family chromosome partitioning protein